MADHSGRDAPNSNQRSEDGEFRGPPGMDVQTLDFTSSDDDDE